MSLIFKHHLILPTFKLNETIPFKNQKSNSITTLRSNGKTSKYIHTSTIEKSPQHIEILANSTEQVFPEISKATIKSNYKLPNLTIRTQYKEKSFKNYLEHLNSLRSQKNTQKQNKFKKVRTETEIIQYGEVKYKRLKEGSSKKLTSFIGNARNTQFQTYIKFSQQIYQLTHNLGQLKDYINNERKLYQVVKSLIGMKKNLRKLILRQNGEELVDFGDISKLCCVREIQYVNGDQKIVDKFDLTLYDDLLYLSEAIENLLLQNQIHAINRISENIKKETDQIQKIQMSLGVNFEEQQLSVQTMPMQRFKIHNEIETIEQKLGPLTLISRQGRQTSLVLGKVIGNLND